MIESGSEPKLCRLDEFCARNSDAMQLPIQIVFPEVEEFAEVGEPGRLVEALPDVALKDVLVVRHPVKDFGGRDPVITQLRNKTPIHREPPVLAVY
jgi:hypothetical protein